MNKKKWISFICLVALVVSCACPGIYSLAKKNQIQDVKDKIEDLEEEKEQSKDQLEELQSDKAYLTGKLKEANTQMSTLAGELTELSEELAQKETEIAQNRQVLDEAKEQEQVLYDKMKLRIRFMYEQGTHDLWEMLFETGSIADFINFTEYVRLVQDYDREKLEEYRAIKEEIQERETKLLQEQAVIEGLRFSQQEKLTKIEETIAKIQKDISDTNQQIASSKEELKRYEEQIKKQKAYEEELRKKKEEEDKKLLESLNKGEQENLKPPVVSDSASDLAILAAIIECEAGGESYEGQVAVGSVVMNRVRSSKFPNTVAEVIYQPRQFTPVQSGRFATVLSRGAKASCVMAAKEVLAGNLTNDCLYFRMNTGKYQGLVIGCHVFF